MVLQIQPSGQTFTGSLSRPSSFNTSDGVRFSGIAREVVTEAIVAARVETDGLHLTTRNPNEAANETSFRMEVSGDNARLTILDIPFDATIPFKRHTEKGVPAVATDWDVAATYSTGARPEGRVIATVDFFGVRRVSLDAIRSALQIAEGQTIGVERTEEQETSDARRRLTAVPGVRAATVDWVCCNEGQVALFVGISETDAPTVHWRGAPTGRIRLPKELRDLVDEHDVAVMRAVARGKNGEDDLQGHALSEDPTTRAIEERFLVAAARNLPVLRDVLRHSADADDRAAAADLLAYAPSKPEVVPDLAFAVSDSSDDVRNNAVRALAVMTNAKSPLRASQITIQPFVDLLNSPVWTDRNKGLAILQGLSVSRDRRLLATLRASALPALVEMARWKSPNHGEPAFRLLGRMVGLPEEELTRAWMRDEREPVIAAALADDTLHKTKPGGANERQTKANQ
jgi:hypothetical protein